ncbi:uncharacterized protein LOC130769223 isoform X8 [Actinidia eriantha]|uniref:uncharacterized protein LOC130769223 isoform X8 n=1 Tax=Actinidia eriantha TaxID=165200 RepID=UPI00258B44EC|nr:uncharacterized protein LOC130769223 isoform X8 [Actinidia eriantha]
MATETDVPDLIPLTKRELEYKELKSELPDVTANEVPQEEKKVESLLIQLPEASKVLDKAEDTAAANFLQVADVNVVNKGDVEAIDGEFFLESPSIADGKSKTNTEKNQLNTNEELCGMHDEEGGMIIDKHLIVKADSVENARVIIQTADLAEGSSMEVENLGEVCNIEEKMGYISSTETTSIEQDLRETSNKEEKKPKIFSSSVGTETDSETIQPNEDIEDNKDKGEEISSSLLATDMNPETKQPSEDREDNKDKGEEMLCADVKDVCMPKETAGPDNHKTEDATESSEAAKDKLDESSSAFKEGSIETTESSEKMKYVMSMEDETQNKDSEPSLAEEVEDKCFQKVENLETFKEESDDELKDIMKESHNGEQNQDVIPKAIDTADSSSSSTDKVGEITEPEAEVSSREPEESMKRESMDLAQIETLTMECKNEGVMAVTGKDDTMAEDQDQIETPQHKEYSEQGSIQTTEQLKVNFESALDVASDEIGKKIHVGSRGEFLGETRNIYTKISEDINMKEIPEQKNLSAVDLDEKNGSAEVEIPNKNGNDLYVTHPPVEVTVQVGDEKHDGVPIPKSGDQFHEAFEAHKEEEMHINDTYEAGKSPESTILEHTFNVCTPGPDNHKTDEATESDEAAEDNLDEISSTKVVPGAGENLENSSMTFEEGSQETIESSENMKDLTSEDEIQNKNSESSLVQKVEDICFQKVEILETFNEEPETELKDIVKGNQNGEHNQNEILKTIATADSSQSIIGKVDDNSEPKANVLSRDFEESTVRESKNLAQTEALTMECKHEGLTAVADEDNTLAEEHDQIETTKHEEHLESSMQKTEPTEENSESTLDVASEEIREQIPVGSPEEVLGETRTVETEISDDINKETPEEKNLSILDLDEKNRSAEVEIPSKNENNLCVTHPNPVEETIHEGGVKHSEVSISELEDQGHEAPKEEEEHVHETFEASKSPESTIVENISTGVPLNIDDLEKRGELNTEEESMEITTVDNIKEEIEQKEKAADEEFHRATTCDDNKKHTFEEEIPVTNSTPLCTGEEPDHYDQEDKSRPNNFDEATPESDGRDQSCKTSNESLNIKEPITEEQAIQEYETKIADKGDEVEKEMKIEEDITTEHSLESAREDTKKCFEDNDTEMGKELETSSKGEDIEKQVLAEESKVQERSIVFAGELEAEDSKEDAMSTKMPKQEVIEVLQTVFGSTNVGMQPKDEDGTEKDNFAVFNREETKNECSYEEEKVEKEPDTEVLETNYRGQDTAEHIIKNCVSIQSAESFEEKTVQQSSHEDEANEHYDNAETSMIISESTITYFPSSSVGDKIVEETLKEDRRDTLRSEEEVSNANTECIVQTFDAPHSIEEREARTLKSEAKPNEGLKDEYIIGSTEQEITPKESNLHIENSSGPETSKREICEAILKKEDSKVTVVAAETSLTEAVSEYTMQVDSSDPVFGEMGLVTEGGTSNIPNPVEGLELGENKGMEIPTTRTHITDEVAGTYTEGKNKAHDTLAGTEDLSEIARAEISLDASEQIIHESSALSMEEHKVVFVEVSDITGEIPEKDSGSCGHVDIPSVAEITKHNIMEMEDETTNPKKMGSTNIEKESANDDAQDEDQEMHTPSELTNEKHINESDVELLNRVSISKVDNCSEIANLETIEDENSSDIGLQKDKSTVNEASKGAEACDRGDDSEKHTFEEDMPVTNSTPLCTEVEADNVDQDDKSAPNSYEEAAPESDSRNQSCRTSNETLNVKKPITEEQEIEEYEDLKIADREKDIKKEEHIITDHSLESAREDITKCFEENKTEAKCKAEMEKELETTNEGEDIEQRVLAEESRVQERTIMSVGELEALKVENSKEDAMITKMPKQEVIEVLQTTYGSTNVGIQIKEEDGTAKDNFVACAGEETKNDCSYEEEKVEKEPDTENIKSVDTGEELRSAPESVAEDESNIAFPETIRTNCEEESNDDGNQTADSIKDQISGQDIQEGKQTTNEEMEPRLETQKETKETQDTILTEKMPREIQRADESEINKEQTMEGESCTKKLHMMAAGDETVHEVTDLDVTPTQSLEVTDSDNLTEMVKPKVAEDFNQEFESSPMRKALEEEIQRAVEKPVDDSSSVSEVSEEKINKENTEDTDRCDTSQQDSEVDSMKLEVLSTMVSQLPIHEDENADYERITVEKSDAHAAEVEETKILDAGSESTGIEEIHETGTSLTIGDIDTNEIEKQITEVPGALPVPIDQGAEAATDDEILAPTVVTEVIRSREFHLNDEPVEALDNSSEAQSLETGKTADSRQQEAEVDNVKLEEAPSMTSHLPTHEHQTADILSMNIEKSDAIDNEETKIPDATSESKTQGATEIHKTETSLTVGETNTNEIEEKIRDTAEALPEPVNQGDEAASNNDIAPGGIVQAEKTEGPLQVSSYALLSNEDDGETTTAIGKAEDACTKKDDPEFDNLKLEETSGMVSKLLGTECESANNVTMEKLDANEVKVEEKETLDVVSEPKDIDFEEVSSSMKVEEASSMTSHLPTHEHQTTNIRSMNIEKSYATDVEVEETKMPDSASESKVQGSREIYETVTSLTVGEIDRSQIEGQIREASETVNQGVEVASNDEIAPECESAIEVTVENSDAAEENKTWDAVYEPKDQDFGEFPSSMRLVEASSMMSHLPIHERQKADILSLNAEKSDAIDNEVEETKTPDAASQSKTQGDTEIHETETSLTAIETDTIEMDKKTRDDTKALSEPINQGGEAASNDEIAPGGIVQAEKIEGPPQVSFSDLLSNEEDGETTTTIGNTEDACTKEDDTDVDNLKLEETSGMDSHRLIAECESSKVTVEKTDANAVKFEENEILDAVSKPGDQDFEEIHETWAIPTAEITDTDKIEEEIKVIENVSYQDVEVVADGQTPAQPLPVGKSEGELPVLSSPLFSSEQDFESRTTIKKKEDKNSINVETEVDMIELEATGMLPKVPTTEHEDVDNVSATIEKSDAEEVDEAKDSEDISESKVHGVAEIQEIGRPTEGKTRTEEAEEERKAVPEAIFEPNYQGVEAIIHGDTTPNQTLPVDREEQLQEPSSAVLNEQDYKTITEVEMRADESTKKAEAQLHQTVADFFEIGATEKPCLQNEGPRELEVSDFDSTAQEDPQNRAPEEESTALEEASTVKPREYIPERNNADFATEYEKTPVHCSSQDTSKDEDIMDSGNSNKDSGDIPIHPEIKKLLPGGVGERCEEASNLESEKTGKVLESVSEIQCLEVNPILEGTKIKNGHLEGAITELRDGQNRSEETIEADESIKKDTSEEKVTGENQVVRNSLTMSPHEETVTNSNQEDELLAEYYRGERTNEELFEESEKAGAGKNIKKTITAEDRSAEDPYQVLVGDETANISPSEEVNDGKKVEKAPVKVDPESRGDKINFRGTAIEATAPIEEVSFEVLLAKHENITGDSSEETVMSKDEKQKNTDVAVPSIKDAVDKEAPDYKFSEKFDEGSTPAPTVPTHETIETCGEDKEIASANSKNSETLMDNEKLNHQSHEISCEGNCNTDGWNLKDKELYVDKPSISCSVATSQAEITNKENENTADEKQDFTSDKQTTEAARLLEKEKGIQFSEELTKVEELVELSTIGNESKRNEANIHSTTDDNEDEKTQNLNEIPNLLSDAKDTGVSHEGDTMDFADVNEITKDTKELEKTSLSIAHEQIARDADPSDSTETINSTATTGVTLVQKCPFEKAFQNAENKSGYAAGSEPEAKAVEYREEEKLGEECQETTEKAIPIDSAKMSLSDLLQRSIKRNLQGVEHLTEEKGVTEKLQTETAETAQVEEAKTDEEEEGGEHKNEDSGSDAQVLVEASTDVKVPHKKSHHIFSGVGSKVKHSIAKVKKVITGKSSHPKTTTPK